MTIIDVWQGHIDIEHEGETFRLSGEATTRGFIAWVSGIQRLPHERAATKSDQLRVMDIVNKYWNNDEGPICFIDDDYNVICDTENKNML